jgi:hypothetical protein
VSSVRLPGWRLDDEGGPLVIRRVGSGPGEITPDGCAVDFYALLPPMGEPEVVHAFVACRDELEEQVGGFGLEGDVAGLVDDQERVAAQPDQFGL